MHHESSPDISRIHNYRIAFTAISLIPKTEERNARLYVRNFGCIKVRPNTDNIFLYILSRIALAKAGNRSVVFPKTTNLSEINVRY